MLKGLQIYKYVIAYKLYPQLTVPAHDNEQYIASILLMYISGSDACAATKPKQRSCNEPRS